MIPWICFIAWIISCWIVSKLWQTSSVAKIIGYCMIGVMVVFFVSMFVFASSL